MNYNEVMDYLEEKVNPIGSILGLATMKELLKRVGNPEKNLKIIHVAGTNGKGSVSSFLAAALIKNGYRIGRYISPSVVDYREKIQVNGAFIPKTKVAEYLSGLFSVAREMEEAGFHHPTTFELETAMAFLYLRDKKCDYCIIEVGMGGREDATNVIPSPELCIITSISLDHVGMIGNNLEEIAKTKAGIIKDGTTVVVVTHNRDIVNEMQKRVITLKQGVIVSDEKEGAYIDE
jgi:dihydrofolate synthase/folylpolyglutamate synthase